MTSRRNYTAIMLEEIREQNRAILKAVGDMQRQVKYIPPMKEDIQRLENADALFKHAIYDLSMHVNDHELRIANLESV